MSAPIGVLLAIAQPMLAQERTTAATVGIGSLTRRDERFREQFERLLLAAPTQDLDQGWQLAVDLGRPAVPLLWELLQNEPANVEPRLILLAAAVLAGGPGEDERLFSWLGSQNTMLAERVMVGLLLAMGPQRPRPVNDFWPRLLGPTKTTLPVLGIAARLAAARFPGAEVGAPPLADDDPGLAAAAAFAGLPVRPVLAARLWGVRTPERHAELYWRGALLGGVRPRVDDTLQVDTLLEHARETMVLPSDQFAAARGAAAVFRSHRRDLRVEGARPDWRLLQLLISEPASAEALQTWLGAVPQPLDDEPQRLAVAYVLSRTPQTVIDERNQWAADARIRRHVATALAFRLLGDGHPVPVDVQLPGVPEWFFVRWAAGHQGRGEGGPIEDRVLETAAGLAVAGRLPRSVARATLEDALWRWGSHPGLGVLESERTLVRDLLLLGSRQGGKYMPHRWSGQRYFAAGIDKDDAFFNIAVPLWDFLSRPRLPLPPEYRLR